MIKFTKAQLQFLKSKFPEIDEAGFAQEALAFKLMREVPDKDRCVAIKKDGERCTKRRGKECGDTCSIHREVPDKDRCVAIKKDGKRCTKRRGKECGDMCSIHRKSTTTSSGEQPSEEVNCATTNEPKETCSICTDKINVIHKMSCCSGSFCKSCIQTWLRHNPSCPLCRKGCNP